MERENLDWNSLIKAIQQPNGCLGLLLLGLPFLRYNNPRWIERYFERNKKYWQMIGKQLIESWKRGKLDLSNIDPEALSRMIELSSKFSNEDLETRQRFEATVLWQMLNQKLLLGENFDDQIKTRNDSYRKVAKIGPVVEIILKDRDPKLAEVFVFGFGDPRQFFEADEKLFQFLEDNLLFIRLLYQDAEGNDYTRKVNKGLYLRHLLRTMVLADRFYHQLREKNVNLNYEVLIMMSALHDVIEISRKNGLKLTKNYLQQGLEREGFSQNDAYNISHAAEFLIPKDLNLSYFEQKKQDFERVWDGQGLADEEKDWWEANRDYLKVIKAVDVLANLEETVDDLQKGRDDGVMKRSLEERYKVFEYRVQKIKEEFKYSEADNSLGFISEKISTPNLTT